MNDLLWNHRRKNVDTKKIKLHCRKCFQAILITFTHIHTRPRNGPPGPAWPKENFRTGRAGLLFLLGRPAQCLTKAFSSPYIDIAIDWNNECNVWYHGYKLGWIIIGLVTEPAALWEALYICLYLFCCLSSIELIFYH